MKKLVKLRSDWKVFLRKAWSIRFYALTVFAQAVEQARPHFDDLAFIPQGYLSALSLLGLLAGLYASFIAQKDFPHADK